MCLLILYLLCTVPVRGELLIQLCYTNNIASYCFIVKAIRLEEFLRFLKYFFCEIHRKIPVHASVFLLNLEVACNFIKGAEATCVEAATKMKKCFRLKDMLNFNIP